MRTDSIRRQKAEGRRRKNEDENSEFSTSVENAFEQEEDEKGRRMKDEGGRMKKRMKTPNPLLR